jgi:hypothetical protein
LDVGVTAGEIRDAGPEAVTRIQLKFSEEGLEWTSIDVEYGGPDRLVVE